MIVEFASANPTGPLHVGHGRGAAVGDAIARLLAAQGFAVDREFYYNDAGAQIMNLALSVQPRIRQAQGLPASFPDDGYQGDYIREIARDYAAEHPGDRAADDLDAIRRFAVAILRREQDADLAAFGIRFDRYYLEATERPKIMAIAIHPYISGQPFRIGYLEKVYEHINKHSGVVHWNGEQILDWYLRARTESRNPPR